MGQICLGGVLELVSTPPGGTRSLRIPESREHFLSERSPPALPDLSDSGYHCLHGYLFTHVYMSTRGYMFARV